MPDGGQLRIEGRCEAEQNRDDRPTSASQNGWIALTFADTGVGIPEETVKAIFNPFFTTKDRGTGLGLAITHTTDSPLTIIAGGLPSNLCNVRATASCSPVPIPKLWCPSNDREGLGILFVSFSLSRCPRGCFHSAQG